MMTEYAMGLNELLEEHKGVVGTLFYINKTGTFSILTLDSKKVENDFEMKFTYCFYSHSFFHRVQVAPTDCRYRPDLRCLENGDMGKIIVLITSICSSGCWSAPTTYHIITSI